MRSERRVTERRASERGQRYVEYNSIYKTEKVGRERQRKERKKGQNYLHPEAHFWSSAFSKASSERRFEESLRDPPDGDAPDVDSLEDMVCRFRLYVEGRDGVEVHV